MHTQNVGPAPELREDRKSRASAKPVPDILVQYPKSGPISLALPPQNLWNEIAAAARSRRSVAPIRAAHLAEAGAEARNADLEAAPASELGSPLSWVMVGAGMALVAGLWSAILL